MALGMVGKKINFLTDMGVTHSVLISQAGPLLSKNCAVMVSRESLTLVSSLGLSLVNLNTV